MSDDHELRGECKTILDELRKALFGNGDPEQSVLVRLCILEKKFSRMEKINLLILAGVIALSGNLIVEIVKHQIDGG